MSAEATLILVHVVVANELAQQEEAHGDSKKKVKRHPVDVTYALDWRSPYNGGTQAGRPAQASRTQAGGTAQAGTQTGSTQAGTQTGGTTQAGTQTSGGPQAGCTQAGGKAQAGTQAGGTTQAGHRSSRDAEQQGAD